jgi:site-specific DNA-methyltransferase (adenine-specific)
MSLYYSDDFVTLYHGDCLTEHREWLSADVLVTDPPYGMAFRSNARKLRSKYDAIAGDESTALRTEMLNSWGTGPALVFGTWKVEKPAGVKLCLTWDKGPSVGSGDITMPWGLSTEDVYVLGEWPRIKPGGRRREGGTPARSSSVLRVENYNTQSADRPDHPTPKPTGLMERLIEKCPPGSIADPFSGSGSTLVAAKNLGRRVIGVELEERYCEIIAKRCAQDVLDIFGAA